MKYSEQIKRLIALDACSTKYANKFTSAQEAWDKCKRPQDMLWLIGRLSGKPQSVKRLKLVLFLTKNIRKTVLKTTQPGSIKRLAALKALNLAKRYSQRDSRITSQDVIDASVAAYTASNSASAASNSASAASSASAIVSAGFDSYDTAIYAAAASAINANYSTYVATKWCKLIRKEWPNVPVITKRDLR